MQNKLEEENINLKKFVSYLRSHLSKYEEVMSYNDFKNHIDNGEIKEEEEVKLHSFVGPDEEEFQEVVKKIGEGATSEVFKVLDTRTGEVMCKKVIKEPDDEETFKRLQHTLKEIEVSSQIHHPCICESLGYNIQEPISTKNEKNEEEMKTTIALFFELLPFSLKEVKLKGLLSNTLKVRIAVEVAFGMSHIHRHGMMHRDLKLDNIMMNSVFDSKIIDFGLVHVNEMSISGSSLTKGVGTLAYMSPEMLNEEEYDNKTDVYSYGIVLFALFTGNLPKQSIRERMTNVNFEYPAVPSNISEYCINLIKRCTAFKATERPTFDDIIKDIFHNEFQLASEIDKKVIIRRFQELNRHRSQDKTSNISQR